MGPNTHSEPVADNRDEVPVGIRRARAAFLRDFPRLLADRRYRNMYVCYHNDELIANHRNHRALIDDVVARKIPEDSYLTFYVVAGEDREQQLIADEAEIDPDHQ